MTVFLERESNSLKHRILPMATEKTTPWLQGALSFTLSHMTAFRRFGLGELALGRSFLSSRESAFEEKKRRPRKIKKNLSDANFMDSKKTPHSRAGEVEF